MHKFASEANFNATLAALATRILRKFGVIQNVSKRVELFVRPK